MWILVQEGLARYHETGCAKAALLAFIDNDGQQCGFCTPGFVVAWKAFLDKNPHPKAEDLKTGLGGNLCRCGTYVGVRAAVMQVSQAASLRARDTTPAGSLRYSEREGGHSNG